jgi:hypothetical protein
MARAVARIHNHSLRKRALQIGVCLLGLAFMFVALRFKPASVDDFLPFYRATHLIGDPDLFAQGRFGHAGLMFLRTPFYAWLLRPLGALDYGVARAIWMTLMAGALALSVVLWPGPRQRIAIAACWAAPVLFAFAQGQDIALVMLVLALTANLFTGGREFAAGLAASLLAVKLTFLFPVALVFLARSRRGFYGLILGTALQFGVSFALQGPAWLPEYLNALRSPTLDQVPTRMPSLRALMPPIPFAVAAILVYAVIWRIARGAELTQIFTVVLPLGMIAMPHCYAYDVAVAVPLFATVFSQSTLPGAFATVALSPIPYMLMSLEHPTPLGPVLIVSAILAGTFTLVPLRLSRHGAGSIRSSAPASSSVSK